MNSEELAELIFCQDMLAAVGKYHAPLVRAPGDMTWEQVADLARLGWAHAQELRAAVVRRPYSDEHEAVLIHIDELADYSREWLDLALERMAKSA